MTDCNICGTCRLFRFLPLGSQPMGNGHLTPGAEDPRFPMDVAKCPLCHTVQLEKPVPFEVLSKIYGNYHYVPVGSTLSAHYTELGGKLALPLAEDAKVLDVGSNDGTLLAAMLKAKPRLQVQGVEPASALAEKARGKGVPTTVGFFNGAIAERLGGPFDLVTFTQVLQHIPDTLGTLRTAGSLLSEHGEVFVEGRYILDTLEEGAFDTFYQELLYEFGLISLTKVFQSAGLHIYDAEHVPVYGGSLRVWAKKTPERRTVRLEHLLETEYEAGLAEKSIYQSFGERAIEKAKEIHRLVYELKGTTAAYGAPSTGTTLLNYCDIAHNVVAYCVDDSPLKQGLLIPGTGIPIRSPTALKEDPPDNVIIIPWRLRKDILAKLKDFRANGGKVIVPLPNPMVVKGD